MSNYTTREFKNSWPQWVAQNYNSLNGDPDNADQLSVQDQIEIEDNYLISTDTDLATALNSTVPIVAWHRKMILTINQSIDNAIGRVKNYIIIADTDDLSSDVKAVITPIAKYLFYSTSRPMEDIWKTTIASDYRDAIKLLEDRNTGKIKVTIGSKKSRPVAIPEAKRRY